GKLLGARYVVFHTGSHRGAGVEAGLDAIVRGVTRVLADTPPEVVLLLENDVGAGNALGSSFEHLAIVLDALPEYSTRLGICLDTAHLWGAGYDIASPAGSAQVLQQFDDSVGLTRLKVIHLNDTKRELGSHRDSHSRLGEGIIKAEGLHAFLSDPRLDRIAVLLETPIKTDENDKEDWEHDAGQIALAKSLAGYSESVL
ncbi:MAG TPA: deoxyribonuclease IV, partial [Ktedonobacteraceae bacterium]